MQQRQALAMHGRLHIVFGPLEPPLLLPLLLLLMPVLLHELLRRCNWYRGNNLASPNQ